MKPLVRGYIHQSGFFIALIACAVLLYANKTSQTFIPNMIYSISLIGMFGVSAFYHINNWSRQKYIMLKRIDHAFIFILIAGTATPICLLGIQGETGKQLVFIFWLLALIGIVLTSIKIHSPKWVRASLYIIIGWLGFLYYPQIKSSLSPENMILLTGGGIIYTIGALIYGFKWPNPFPTVFGYHEIFHVLVLIASSLHFILIFNLTTP